jgi:hypothetical protein
MPANSTPTWAILTGSLPVLSRPTLSCDHVQPLLNDLGALLRKNGQVAVRVYHLGRAVQLRAGVWWCQHRPKDTGPAHGPSCERFGAANGTGYCRGLLQVIERAMRNMPPRIKVRPTGEPLGTMPSLAPVLIKLTFPIALTPTVQN